MADFYFIDELFKLVGANIAEAESQLDAQFKRAIFSPAEDERYQDLLTQYKVIYRVYRNPQGKHKVVEKAKS